MAKSKVNYDAFSSFDMNECCDHFDCEDQRLWKKIGKFIVADGQEYVNAMVEGFDYDQEDVGDGEHDDEQPARLRRGPRRPLRSCAPIAHSPVSGIL